MRKKAGIILLTAVLLLTGCARGDAAASYQAGCKALEAGRYQKAEKQFRSTIQSKYYLAEAYRGLGIAEMCGADYAEACIAFERSILNIEKQDESFYRDVSLYLAYCRSYNGQSDKALEIYDQLLKRNADDTDVLFLRGRAELSQNKDKAARRDFNAATAKNPEYDLYINIFQCYDRLGKNGDGSEFLEKALKIADQNEDDSYSKGLVNYYLENYEDARDNLIAALKSNPENARASLLLGQVYLKMNDTADARAVYTSALKQKNSEAGAYNGLTLCDLADGDYDSALQHVEAGIKLDDDDANQGLYYNEIVVYENKRDWATAKAKAAAYVAKYPTDEAGARENEFLKSR